MAFFHKKILSFEKLTRKFVELFHILFEACSIYCLIFFVDVCTGKGMYAVFFIRSKETEIQVTAPGTGSKLSGRVFSSTGPDPFFSVGEVSVR